MENESGITQDYTAIISSLRAENEAQKAHIAELEQQINWLLEQTKLARKKQYAPSSEKGSYNQLSIFNEAEEAAVPDAPEPEITQVKTHYRRRTRLTTDKLPEDIPVEVIEHELSDGDKVCTKCGSEMPCIGKEEREELKIVPAQTVLVKHISYTHACRSCNENGTSTPIRKSEMPKPVIKGGFASPESIAYIMVQKFMMASPLNRLEQEFKTNGILLSKQTMSNWLIKASHDWLKPIYDALHLKLLDRQVLHADETILQVLHEEGKTAQSDSRMWLYRTSGDAESPIILFEYQPDRKKEHPEAFLKGFTGWLHADGYSGYHALPGSMTVVGCWAHARRKLNDALAVSDDHGKSLALTGRQYCDKLFALERQFAHLKPDERKIKRNELSKPIMDEFRAWLDSLNVFPKSVLGTAIHYTLSQWEYLERYLTDGRLEISNNRAERSIRPFVIGRKNWLFSNTPNGAKSSAIIYSIIETARENGLNPFKYLTHVFRTAPNTDLSIQDNLDALLPENAPAYCKVQASKPSSNAWDVA
jgi:transposase